MNNSILNWSRSLLLVAILGLTSPVIAAVCAGSSSSLASAAPQADFIRAYRYDFASPIRLAVDAAGSVYVADSKRGEVVVRAADGRVLQRQQGLGRPGAIAVDEAGQIYLADLDTGLISVYDSEWQTLFQFGVGEIQRPGDIAIDNTGNRVYVSDSELHTVVVFSGSGERLFNFASEGNGDTQLQYPSGIFFDPLRNEILVSDQFGYRIQVFAANGDWLYCLAGSSARPGSFFQRGRQLSAPQGLWVDALGRVYVADSYEGQIKVLDRSGRLLSRIGSFGSTDGELRIPSDVVLDPFGRLFVASTNNARLEVFGIDAFTDPEQFAPALLAIHPATLKVGSGGSISIQIKVPGYRPADIQTDSIRANGIAALTVEIGDFDGDAVLELLAVFDQQAILATLPPSGAANIHLQGALPLLTLDGTVSVEVMPRLVLDTDLDGVADNLDVCVETPVGAIVDASGCALLQLCSCEEMKSHGHYVKCVTRTAKAFMASGLMDPKQRKQATKQAARSDCGKRHKRHKHSAHEDHKNRHKHELDERDGQHEEGEQDYDDDRQRRKHKDKKSKQANMNKEDRS